MQPYTLLQESPSNENCCLVEGKIEEQPDDDLASRTHLWIDHQGLILVLVLLITNGVWMFRSIASSRSIASDVEYYVLRDKGEIVGNRVSVPYQTGVKGFVDGNITIYAPYWRSMFPAGDGVVGLSDVEVANFGLPPSLRGKSDPSKSIYLMAGFHQLHCLSHVRFILNNYYWNASYIQSEATWNHTLHCIDNVRQRLMCAPDEAFMAEFHGDDLGEGVSRQCKNFTAYSEWAFEHRYVRHDVDDTED